ncbi:MutS-related protein [Clostridium sp. LBM24168]
MNYIDKTTLEEIGYYHILDKLSTSCVYTGDILHDLKPLKKENKLLLEYSNIQQCFSIAKDNIVMDNFKNILRRFKDIRNTFTRCSEGNVLDEVELYEIKYFVGLNYELEELYEDCDLDIYGVTLYDFSEIYKLLNPIKSKTSSFYIYDEYSSKLRDIRYLKKKLDGEMFREKDSKRQRELFEKRQKLVDRESAVEYEIRRYLSFNISRYVDELLYTTLSLGRLDIALAKSKLTLDYDMCCPKLSAAPGIYMKNAVNPVIKEQVTKRGGRFYPISIDAGEGTTVITGANMGGKTVVLRTILLNYVMSVMGFYTFSDYFEFSPLDFVCFLSEDLVPAQNGLSSFGGEMLELKKILDRVKNERGLIIIDEFARGTNPAEGSNIAKALVSYMNRFNSICIVSTHYDGVCNFAKLHYQVRGLKNVDFKKLHKSGNNSGDYLKSISDSMDYTLERVDKDIPIPRDAINICSLIGIDEEIINIAEKLYDKEGKYER